MCGTWFCSRLPTRLSASTVLIPSFPSASPPWSFRASSSPGPIRGSFPGRGSAIFRPGLVYGLALGVLSWSFTTLAVAAKNIMASVPFYVELETGFTLLQFAIVGPLTALAHRN